MLTNLLPDKYEKNSQTIYEELKDRQQDAIKHAKRLLQEYDRPNPETDNPSTTVHLLVEELNSFIPDCWVILAVHTSDYQKTSNTRFLRIFLVTRRQTRRNRVSSRPMRKPCNFHCKNESENLYQYLALQI